MLKWQNSKTFDKASSLIEVNSSSVEAMIWVKKHVKAKRFLLFEILIHFSDFTFRGLNKVSLEACPHDGEYGVFDLNL